MDDQQFDELIRRINSGLSRRRALRSALGGLAAGVVGGSALSAEAKKGKQAKTQGKKKSKKVKATCEGSDCHGTTTTTQAGTTTTQAGTTTTQAGCRPEGHPCEGNQVCCPGLVCQEAAGPGQAARCVSPGTTTTQAGTTTTPKPDCNRTCKDKGCGKYTDECGHTYVCGGGCGHKKICVVDNHDQVYCRELPSQCAPNGQQGICCSGYHRDGICCDAHEAGAVGIVVTAAVFNSITVNTSPATSLSTIPPATSLTVIVQPGGSVVGGGGRRRRRRRRKGGRKK